MAAVALTPAQARKSSAGRARARKASQLRKARARAEDFIEYAIRDEETGRVLKNAPFHKEWQAHWRAHVRSLLIAPVEHGKTQQVVGKVVHLLGNDHNLRIATISNTAKMGQKLLRPIRTHIERNPQVREVFPTLLPSDLEEDPWHSSMITVQRDTIAKDPSVQAHGVFGDIVGSRLDVIILDDILDFENTRTEEQRNKLLEWLDTTVFTRATKNCIIIVIGTPWQPEDVLHKLEKRPGFVSKRYCAVENPLEDPERWRPIWPSQWPVARLRDRQDNTPETTFVRKYFCLVRTDSTSRFKEAWLEQMVRLGKGLTFCAEAPMAQGGVRRLPCFTGVDLGVGQKKENALTVFYTLALQDNTRRLTVNIESGRWQSPEIIDRLESHYRRFDSVLQVESNGAQTHLIDMARDKSIPIVSHNTGSNKWDEEWGIESLAVEMRNGLWVMPSGATGENVHPEGLAFIRGCLNFNPTEHTPDHVIAAWLAWTALKTYSTSMTQRMDTLSR